MDIDPEKRTGLLEQAALSGEEEIGGLKLRPMTYGTHSYLQRLKLACEEQGGIDDNFYKAAFVFLHCKPVAYLAANYAHPQKIAAEIVEFMFGKPYSYFQQFEEWRDRQISQYAASVTQSTVTETEDPKV